MAPSGASASGGVFLLCLLWDMPRWHERERGGVYTTMTDLVRACHCYSVWLHSVQPLMNDGLFHHYFLY